MIASLGLIFAQVLWIYGVYNNKQNELRVTVGEVLNRVVEKVSQEELTMHLNSYDSDSAILNDLSEVNSTGKVILGEIYSNDLNTNTFVDRMKDNRKYQIYFLLSVLEKETHSSIPVEQRVTIMQLDTLISHDFRHLNINYEYRIAVCDAAHKTVIASPDYEPQDDNTVFEERLFQRDPEGSDTYMLNLYFPKERAMIISSIWAPMISALGLVVAILTIFIYTMYVITKQKKVSEVKNSFISNITHELKTPISTISIAAQMLGDEKIPQSAKNIPRLSSMIMEQSKQLTYLVEKVLQTSVFERQTMTLNKQPVSLHAIIKEADDIMTLQLRNKKATLIMELRAVNDTIATDKSYFVNVITNLLDNALKYSRGVPRITVGTRNESSSVVCYVADNGIGISEADQANIFDQFFRVVTGNIHDVKGFGLGLNYVKKIVELSDGTISVESKINVGTTFYMRLPLVNNS
jgi:signal transduction histidine kinase